MNAVRSALVVTLAVLLGGCSLMDRRSGSSSSLVDYLYPDGSIPPGIDERVPVIALPARVGLAFVPSRGWNTLGEAQMSELLEIVRQAFSDRDYIERIEIIPQNYLQAKGGFEGLAQVGRLYGVDLVALVSYDQVLTSADQASSILYWTIVGAYMIPGTSNQVNTFVDTAVFDLSTQRLLFRAPGVDERSRRSTGVGVTEVSREVGEESFAAAMQQMTGNLDAELERFRERIKEDQSVQLVNRSGGGMGAADVGLLLVLLLGLAWRECRHG